MLPAEKVRLFEEIVSGRNKKPIARDDFDQLIFDAIARDPTMTRIAVLRWAKQNYVVQGIREENVAV